jgi:hypothetical protein
MAANNANRCGGQGYNKFGPVVDDCAHQFDFTLLFEESIMAILPSAFLLLLTPIRLATLSRKQRIVGGNALRIAKIVRESQVNLCTGVDEIQSANAVHLDRDLAIWRAPDCSRGIMGDEGHSNHQDIYSSRRCIPRQLVCIHRPLLFGTCQII